MNNPNPLQPNPIGRLRMVSTWITCSIGLIALLALIGWQFDLELFKRPIPGLVAMNPLTAVCLLAASGSLIIYNRGAIGRAGQLLAAIPLLVGLLVALKRVTGWGPSLQTLLFADKLRVDAVGKLSNAIAINTAGCCLLVGTALIMLPVQRKSTSILIQWLAVLTGLLTLVTLLGYVYQVSIFYGALASYPMAIHTALCFLGLSLGLLLTTANGGFIQLLFNRWVAGLPGQSLIWTSLLVPFLAGWLSLSGFWQGLWSTELAIAGFVTLLTLTFIGFIWHTLWLLNQKDLHQQVTQQQLEQANAKLLRSNENLQQFAYVASHDLQEPLRKIQQFGDLLNKQYSDQLGKGLPYLDRMQLSAKRMSVLIKDLLSFSRISTDSDQSVPVSLNQVFSQVMADLELRIEETGAVLDIDPLPTLLGDASQLEQLFQNLLSNALKFQAVGKEGSPRIQVRSRQVALDALPMLVKPARITSQYYRIDVADNGIGFDEKYLDRLFQVFQRLHGKHEFAGTGIGLAICQKVVANHGGAITARSKPGEGATFSVYLPV